MSSSRVSFFFRWYDLWIGAYWDRRERVLYVCPIPMAGVRIECFDREEVRTGNVEESRPSR